MQEKIKKERIPLLYIFKEDGHIYAEIPEQRSTSAHELYGFLSIYVKVLEDDLYNGFEFE